MNEEDIDTTEIEERLNRSRPVPRAAFRGELRRHLVADVPRQPARARRLVAVYAASGSALLLLAAVGVAGAGPLAAG